MSVKLCFSVTFNIIISYIFTKNTFSLSEDMNFYFFIFKYYRQFSGFLYLYLLQKN